MIFVEGDEFQMGNLSEILPVDKQTFSSQRDERLFNNVKLLNYIISKCKITYSDFDTYAFSPGLPLLSTSEKTDPDQGRFQRLPNATSFPVAANWNDVPAYCTWLGEQIGTPMVFPNEAQWEYAARARGQLLIYATDNGPDKQSRHYRSENDVKQMNGDMEAHVPIGLYAHTMS
jgi:formylglycine-generating enzyme required for sulfatase activity